MEKTQTKTFDVAAACAGQKAYVQEKGYPDFAPADGRCFKCRRNIYEEVSHGDHKTGISVETAAGSLVTGCPHCHFSYCE